MGVGVRVGHRRGHGLSQGQGPTAPSASDLGQLRALGLSLSFPVDGVWSWLLLPNTSSSAFWWRSCLPPPTHPPPVQRGPAGVARLAWAGEFRSWQCSEALPSDWELAEPGMGGE